MSNAKKYLLVFLVLILILGLAFIIKNLSQKNTLDTKGDWDRHDQELKSLDQTMQTISTRIKSLAGQGVCKDDYQCRVVGLGAKTCDGYANFLVYSTFDTNENLLLQAVEQFNETDQRYLELSMKVATCGNKALPAKCFNGRCTVNAQ